MHRQPPTNMTAEEMALAYEYCAAVCRYAGVRTDDCERKGHLCKRCEKHGRSLKIVNVHVEYDPTGMFVATSPELKGLLVAKQSLEDVQRAIPKAIAEIHVVDAHPPHH